VIKTKPKRQEKKKKKKKSQGTFLQIASGWSWGKKGEITFKNKSEEAWVRDVDRGRVEGRWKL